MVVVSFAHVINSLASCSLNTSLDQAALYLMIYVGCAAWSLACSSRMDYSSSWMWLSDKRVS